MGQPNQPPADPNQPPANPPADPPTPPSSGAPWTPPSREEWERTQAALKKANDDQRALRQKALDDAKAKGEADARAEAEKAAEEKYAPLIKNTAIAAALNSARCTSTERLAQLVDKSKLTIDAGGNVLGLEAEVNALKASWPEFFKTDGPPPAGQVAAGQQRGVTPPAGQAGGGKSTAERLAAGLTGRG